MPSIIKVAIVEGDGGVLECLRNLFDNSPGFVCDGAFGALEPAVEKLGNSQPDVVLLDFDLPEDLSISGLRQIKATLPRVRIIMFTNSPNYDRIVESLRSGACGYWLKSDSSADLLRAIYELHEEKASPIGWAKVTPPSLSAP